MQISSVKEVELGLLITGLRAIHVADQELTKHKLLIQLETELATRFGRMIGTASEQERNTTRD
jgi:hypothetical protein